MTKNTITNSTINSHILQKKKILQIEIHKHTRNFPNSKSDKDHVKHLRWKLWYSSWFSCVLYVIFIFTMSCNVYCLSYAVFLLVLTVIVIVCMLFVFLCFMSNAFNDFGTFWCVYWHEHKDKSGQIHNISHKNTIRMTWIQNLNYFTIMCSIKTKCHEIMVNVININS